MTDTNARGFTYTAWLVLSGKDACAQSFHAWQSCVCPVTAGNWTLTITSVVR